MVQEVKDVDFIWIQSTVEESDSQGDEEWCDDCDVTRETQAKVNNQKNRWKDISSVNIAWIMLSRFVVLLF